ncbi:MAG: polysaccharide deacetylase family protein [Anaerocolumna sp.]
MNIDEENKDSSLNLYRKKRIARMKRIICIVLVILLLLPSLLCIIMFRKIMSLQHQVDILMVNTYGTTYSEGNKQINAQIIKKNSTVTHVGNDNYLFFEESLYKKAEEYAASIEESEESEYNIEESTNKEEVEQVGQEETNDKNSNQELAANLNIDNLIADKKVYLTFDDGPSSYTDEILDILNEYNVKATFFVIGKTDEESVRLYKRIVEEGHTLGMHSFSHDYKYIYNSLEDFEKDFTKLRDLLYDTTGYFPTIFRFPGGSANGVSREDISVFIEYLNKESVVYYDWNVVNGDATGEPLTAKESYNNVLDGVKTHNRSIVLMHDTDKKESTIESLENILKTLLENNAKVLPLNDDVIPIQQVSNSLNETNK